MHAACRPAMPESGATAKHLPRRVSSLTATVDEARQSAKKMSVQRARAQFDETVLLKLNFKHAIVELFKIGILFLTLPEILLHVLTESILKFKWACWGRVNSGVTLHGPLHGSIGLRDHFSGRIRWYFERRHCNGGDGQCFSATRFQVVLRKAARALQYPRQQEGGRN